MRGHIFLRITRFQPNDNFAVMPILIAAWQFQRRSGDRLHALDQHGGATDLVFQQHASLAFEAGFDNVTMH